MTRHALLLRAVNLGARRKVPMARLRELLSERGYEDVRTLLASGNVVVGSEAEPEEVAADVAVAVEGEWGFEVPVVARSAVQLRAVLDTDPVPGASADPKRYLVTFYAGRVPDAVPDLLAGLDLGEERYAVLEGEVCHWAPNGVHGSVVSTALGSARAGGLGTARNWATVRKLAALAEED